MVLKDSLKPQIIDSNKTSRILRFLRELRDLNSREAKRLPIFSIISVFALHAAIITWALYSPTQTHVTHIKEKFIVKTIALNPPTKLTEKKELPSTSVQPLKSKKTPSPLPKKKPKPTLTPKEKSLNAAKEKIAKLRETRDKLMTAKETTSLKLQDLALIDALKIDGISSANVQDSGYYELLSSKLKQVLKLPAQGSVKILLKLDRSGKLIFLEIVSSENESNRKFIETTLKKTQFPPFGKSFNGKNDHTFPITFESAS